MGFFDWLSFGKKRRETKDGCFEYEEVDIVGGKFLRVYLIGSNIVQYMVGVRDGDSLPVFKSDGIRGFNRVGGIGQKGNSDLMNAKGEKVGLVIRVNGDSQGALEAFLLHDYVVQDATGEKVDKNPLEYLSSLASSGKGTSK